MIVMMVVVVMKVVMMYTKEEWNLCWFRSQTRILMMIISQYVITGPLLILPTQLQTTTALIEW